MRPCIARFVAAPIALILALAGPSLASSEDPDPSDEAAIRQGHAIVVGSFDGTASTDVRVYPDQFDDDGNRITHREVVTRHGFTVSEVLDGEALPAAITIVAVGGTADGMTTPGSFDPSPPGQPVVLAVSPASRGDGYVAVHAKRFDVADAAHLATLRDWVRQVRAPDPVEPQAIAEGLTTLGAPPAPADPDLFAAVPDIPPGWQPDAPEAPVERGEVPVVGDAVQPAGALNDAIAPVLRSSAPASTGAPARAPATRRADRSPWLAIGALGAALVLALAWLRLRP